MTKKPRKRRIVRKDRLEVLQGQLDKARRSLTDAADSVNHEIESIKRLRLGERVAQIETMVVQVGIDLHKLTFVLEATNEWRSLSFWARVKRVLRG